jgi:hypothetical protein
MATHLHIKNHICTRHNTRINWAGFWAEKAGERIIHSFLWKRADRISLHACMECGVQERGSCLLFIYRSFYLFVIFAARVLFSLLSLSFVFTSSSLRVSLVSDSYTPWISSRIWMGQRVELDKWHDHSNHLCKITAAAYT